MKLPSLPLKKKKEKPEYFLALILTNEKLNAVVFEELSGKIKMAGQGEEILEKSVEDLTNEELLSLSDKVISQAETLLPQDVETHKTIFGLKESWTEDNKIKKEYLEKLKKIGQELTLEPMGFIIVTEAIVNMLQKEEGAPVSAVLASIGKKSVTVSLVRAGKIIETKCSQIHEDAAFTVDTLLKHFQLELLPSRVILNSDDESLSQSFITHQWSKSLPFLHLPQIVNLEEGFDIKSVLFGAATQMGFEVSSDVMPKKPSQIPPMDDFAPEKEIREEEQEVKTQEEEETSRDNTQQTPQRELESSESFGAGHFGFVGEDVAKMPAEEEKEEEKEEIKEQEPQKAVEEDEQFRKFPETARADYEEKSFGAKKSFAFAPLFKNFLPSVLGFFGKIKIPGSFNFKNKTAGLILAAVIGFIVLIVAFYYLTLSATVTIDINPQNTQTSKNVTFSTSAKSDLENAVISGELIEVSEDGSVSTPATGKKETGTNAKGTITLYSRFTQDKTFPQGTAVASSNGLEFTLDKDVKVASASADASADPKTADVAVVAKKIGKEYNLPSGAKFTVGSFSTSDIIAKNNDPFSGGDKKDITVVSEEDVDKLGKDIIKSLDQKAKESLAKKIDNDKVLISALFDPVVDSKKFDKKVNDEAGKVNLSATVTYKGLSYSKKDLVNFVKDSLKDKLPEDLTINEDDLKIDVTDTKKTSETEIGATLKIKAMLVPDIDKDKLAQELAGLSIKNARQKLSKLPQISNTVVTVSPRLPFFPEFLPKSGKKIKVIINSNG